LVEEASASAPLKRVVIEGHAHAAQGVQVRLLAAFEVVAKILQGQPRPFRVVLRGVAAFAQGVEWMQHDPWLRGGKDGGVPGQDALKQGRTGTGLGDGKDEVLAAGSDHNANVSFTSV